MPRNPIGERAMTGAERQRRRRERLRQAEPAKPAKPDATAELVAARAEIKRLRAAAAKPAAPQPLIDRSALSPTAQEKLDAALRRYQRELGLKFERRVSDDVRRRLDEIILPHWKEQIDKAQQLYKHRRGAMDKATFNKIRRALHPDSRNSISDKMLGDAFDTFMRLEKFLLDEKDSPTEFGAVPSSLAEWDAMKRKTSAERRAKRGHSTTPARRR